MIPAPALPVLVDSHAHLDGPEFEADRETVIERARAAGVRYMLLIGGADPDNMGAALPIAESHDRVFAAAGIHPHEASKMQKGCAEILEGLAGHPRLVAVGEIGLDYYYDHSSRQAQQCTFVRQMEMARALKKPIIIHCRDAWGDLRALVSQHWRSSGIGGVLHCFTGAREDAFDLLDAGFLVSFAGNLTFKKAGELREVARDLPADRLLTETDCPYLAPVPYRGRRNEPAFVLETLRQLAALHKTAVEDMGRLVCRNFERFFNLA